MTAPTCSIIEASEMAALGDTLGQLWLITVFALLAMRFDWYVWEFRVRRFLRRRRIQRIRAAKLVAHG